MSTIQYPPGTAGQRLGITRIISKTLGDLPWTFAYDGDGRLVTMMPSDEYEIRVLEKRAKPEEGVALEFQDVFKIDDNDDSELGPDDCADPVGALVRKFSDDALYKAIDDAGWPGWDEIIGERVEKSAGPILPTTGTLAKRLGIVRTEQVLIDCGAGPEKWSHGFNAAGELVGAKLILEADTYE